MLEVSQKPGGEMGVRPNTFIHPKISSLMNIFYDQKLPNYLPKGVYRTSPENAFMNVYF
jgi:hypothetical protein